LSDAAVPSRWAPTGNSLDPRRGAQVFVDLAQAAQSLSPVAGAQSLVGDLVATGRGLARRALDADA